MTELSVRPFNRVAISHHLLLNLLKTNQTEKRKRVQICKWRIEEENRREKKGRERKQQQAKIKKLEADNKKILAGGGGKTGGVKGGGKAPPLDDATKKLQLRQPFQS